MAEEKQKRKKKKPLGRWGISQREFYYKLREKPIGVALIDDKVYSGLLVGVDQFDIFIRQRSGIVLLIPKHAIEYCAPAVEEGEV